MNYSKAIETLDNIYKETKSEIGEAYELLSTAQKITVSKKLIEKIKEIDISVLSKLKFPFENIYVEAEDIGIWVSVNQKPPYHYMVFSNKFNKGVYVGILKFDKLPRFYLMCKCDKATYITDSFNGEECSHCMRTPRTACACEISPTVLVALQALTFSLERFSQNKNIVYKVKDEISSEDKSPKENFTTNVSYIYLDVNRTRYISDRKIENRKPTGEHLVRGYIRTLKSGKTVEIKPFKRGKGDCKTKERVYIIKS